MFDAITKISVFAIPIMLFFILASGFYRQVNVYECFISGAEDGMKTVINIFPILLAILMAVAMFRASGAMDMLINWLMPITKAINIPEKVIPLAILRPISGGGSIGILTDLLNTDGADTMAGRIASVMMGSTETTFYTLAVYFRTTRVKYTNVVLPAALMGDLTGIVVSVWVCRLFFG